MHFSAFDAYLFDLDGVITPTAEVHMKAWGEMFNAFLAGFPGQEPWTDADYFAHVDGKPRYDGVRDFLTSRGIELPEGDPSDTATRQSICGLGNRKNATFNEIIRRDGVIPYPGSGALIDALRARDAKLAVVSSSRNAVPVLRAAGLETFGDPILSSEAVLITTEQYQDARGLATLVRRLEGVLRARSYVLVDYDVPMNKLQEAAALTPGIESPTVSPLQNPDWVALRAMVPRADMNRIMDELYEVGARAILVSSLLACRL